MKWFRRGRHRAHKHSLRVADITPSMVPGLPIEVQGTYAMIERYWSLVGLSARLRLQPHYLDSQPPFEYVEFTRVPA